MCSRVEAVTQSVAQEVERQQGDAQESTGPSQQPRVATDRVQLRKPHRCQVAPARQRRLDTDAQEAQERLLKDGLRDGQRRVDDDRTDEIGQDVDEEDAWRGAATGP